MGQLSIVCPSYNHEQYIKEFIESVISQRDNDFELIIIDDNSTDRTYEIAKLYQSEKIKVFRNKKNRGCNYSIEKGIRLSSGEIISICASDDLLCNDYVDVVKKRFKEKDIGVLFVSAFNVNNKGYVKLHQKKFFQLKEIDKYKLIEKLFFCGNCLPSVGMAFKKEEFIKILPINYAFANLQDYHINIKLIINTKVGFEQKKIVKYRITEDNKSLSRQKKARQREISERYLLMDSFKAMDEIVYEKVFRERLEKILGERSVEANLYKKSLKCNDLTSKIWGYTHLMNLADSRIRTRDSNDVFKELLELAEDLTEGERNKRDRRRILFLAILVIILLCINMSLILR